MTAPYVLDLSRDGVRLLTATGPDSALVGEVRRDDPHFDARLADLRRTAAPGDGGPVPVTLLVPTDEVAFAALGPETAPGGAAPSDRLRSALEGVSDRPAADLVYDWQPGPDGGIRIAAVAREVLKDAENLAAAHGFRAARFSARETPGAFRGAPDFGPAPVPDADGAAAYRGGSVEPDGPAGAAVPAGTAAAAEPPPPERPAGQGAPGIGARGVSPRDDIASRISGLATHGPVPPRRDRGAGPAAARSGPPPLVAPIRPSREEAEGLAPSPPAPDRRETLLAPVLLGLSVALVAAAGIWGAYFVLSADEVAPPAREVAALAPDRDAAVPAPVRSGPAPSDDPVQPASPVRPASETAGADDPPSPAGAPVDPVAPVSGPERVAAPIAPEDGPSVAPAAPAAPETGLEPRPEGRDGETASRVRVTEGPPPVAPPPAPARSGTSVAEVAEVAADASPRVPPVRPRIRPAVPDGIAAPTTAVSESPDAPSQAGPMATTLNASEPGDTVATELPASLAALPPRPRPADPVPAASAPAIDTAVEDALQDAMDVDADPPPSTILPDAVAPTDPSAVARSLRPGSRPGDLAAPAAEPVRVATAEATLTPRTPTAGSVRTGATNQNSLRLNEVNLIGVYGTQSNRRALVRLPNGRFVKVKVGDRVDGGRVSEIGSDDLQYLKGGRSVNLSMPRG